jgi:hypothetical protein
MTTFDLRCVNVPPSEASACSITCTVAQTQRARNVSGTAATRTHACCPLLSPQRACVPSLSPAEHRTRTNVQVHRRARDASATAAMTRLGEHREATLRPNSNASWFPIAQLRWPGAAAPPELTLGSSLTRKRSRIAAYGRRHLTHRRAQLALTTVAFTDGPNARAMQATHTRATPQPAAAEGHQVARAPQAAP